MSKLQMIEGGVLGDDEKKLFNELEYCSQALIKQKYSSANAVDYSRSFIIVSYNYFTIGQTKRAVEILREVELDYFDEKFLTDIKDAIAHGISAKLYHSEGKMDLVRKSLEEAEFLIVAVKMIPYFLKDPTISIHPGFQKVMVALRSKEFAKVAAS